ncbi:LysR family transcriptional regulator [Vibrio sp. 10N.286.49.E11]|uniref:LysR family transcriptional regulator n=1 Tax=Vibrio sp. 10N.286.49.E11 TaxID=3229703 RepID=UPI00354D1A0E
MNIEHLKLFVRLASTHNIGQAGQELGLSPPVASIHIGKLEESLGAIRVDHGEAVRDVCVDGLGIAICASWIAYKQLAEGSLVEVLPDYPLKDEAAIWAVYPSAQLLAPKVRVFIDYFVQYYGSPSYWDCDVNGQTQ